jgi:hypothetical protein
MREACTKAYQSSDRDIAALTAGPHAEDAASVRALLERI